MTLGWPLLSNADEEPAAPLSSFSFYAHFTRREVEQRSYSLARVPSWQWKNGSEGVWGTPKKEQQGLSPSSPKEPIETETDQEGSIDPVKLEYTVTQVPRMAGGLARLGVRSWQLNGAGEPEVPHTRGIWGSRAKKVLPSRFFLKAHKNPHLEEKAQTILHLFFPSVKK